MTDASAKKVREQPLPRSQRLQIEGDRRLNGANSILKKPIASPLFGAGCVIARHNVAVANRA